MSAKDLEGVMALGGRLDTRRHRMWQVYRFGPQNRTAAGLPVWASKLEARLVRLDGGCEGHVMLSLSLRRGEVTS